MLADGAVLADRAVLVDGAVLADAVTGSATAAARAHRMRAVARRMSGEAIVCRVVVHVALHVREHAIECEGYDDQDDDGADAP